jgi:hypothetical protein
MDLVSHDLVSFLTLQELQARCYSGGGRGGLFNYLNCEGTQVLDHFLLFTFQLSALFI